VDGVDNKYWLENISREWQIGILERVPLDTDNDSVFDFNDNCPNHPNTDQADADTDNIGDVCEADDDGDGIPEEAYLTTCRDGNTTGCNDNCPTKCNSEQLDANNNTIGDICDPSPGCGGCGTESRCEQECTSP
jgi:hypothetical protein